MELEDLAISIRDAYIHTFIGSLAIVFASAYSYLLNVPDIGRVFLNYFLDVDFWFIIMIMRSSHELDLAISSNWQKNINYYRYSLYIYI